MPFSNGSSYTCVKERCGRIACHSLQTTYLRPSQICRVQSHLVAEHTHPARRNCLKCGWDITGPEGKWRRVALDSGADERPGRKCLMKAQGLWPDDKGCVE